MDPKISPITDADIERTKKMGAEIRRATVRRGYEYVRPLIQDIARRLNYKRNGVMLDIGTGDGIVALETAREFEVSKIMLTDVKNDLLVELPPHASFQMIDVAGCEFVHRFQNKPTVVTCFKAFHEFAEQFLAAIHLISVLPEKGQAFIMDYTEGGWRHLKDISNREGIGSIWHYVDDMERLKALKEKGLDLGTNLGIREFWEERIFPFVPGECYLFFHGDTYLVVYNAKQWREVKPFPRHPIPR